MTGTSTQGIKTVLHPVSDLERPPSRCTPPFSAYRRSTTPAYYVGLRGRRASTSGWCPAADRRA